MSLATPHKKTRRAATVAKQRLKSHVVGKKRKALQRQHQKVADTDDDDDDDPDATEEEEEPDDDDDEEEEDDCPITKRRKRNFGGRLQQSDTKIPFDRKQQQHQQPISTATASSSAAAGTIMMPAPNIRLPIATVVNRSKIGTSSSLKLNKTDQDNLKCKAEMAAVDILGEYHKMDAIVRHKLSGLKQARINAEHAQLHATLHAIDTPASASGSIPAAVIQMPSLYHSPLQERDWLPSHRKITFKESKGGHSITQPAQRISKCLQSVLSCCELATPAVELVTDSSACLGKDSKKDLLQNWMVPRERLSKICIKFFEFETTLKKTLTAFMPKYLGLLNQNLQLYDHWQQLVGALKAPNGEDPLYDVRDFYFGVRLRPEFQHEFGDSDKNGSGAKGTKYKKQDKKSKTQRETLGIQSITNAITGSGIRPPMSRKAKLETAALALQAVNTAKAAAAAAATGSSFTPFLIEGSVIGKTLVAPPLLQATSQILQPMMLPPLPPAGEMDIQSMRVLHGYAPITTIDVAKSFTLLGYDCMLFEIHLPHIDWPKLKDNCPGQVQNDELFIKFDYEMTPLAIDDHHAKALRHVEIRHKQAGLSQLYERDGYQRLIVLSNYHTVTILIAPIHIWNNQCHIYHRMRSQLFGFYPEFEGHQLFATSAPSATASTGHHLSQHQPIKHHGDPLFPPQQVTMAAVSASAALANDAQWLSIKSEPEVH